MNTLAGLDFLRSGLGLPSIVPDIIFIVLFFFSLCGRGGGEGAIEVGFNFHLGRAVGIVILAIRSQRTVDIFEGSLVLVHEGLLFVLAHDVLEDVLAALHLLISIFLVRLLGTIGTSSGGVLLKRRVAHHRGQGSGLIRGVLSSTPLLFFFLLSIFTIAKLSAFITITIMIMTIRTVILPGRVELRQLFRRHILRPVTTLGSFLAAFLRKVLRPTLGIFCWVLGHAVGTSWGRLARIILSVGSLGDPALPSFLWGNI